MEEGCKGELDSAFRFPIVLNLGKGSEL